MAADDVRLQLRAWYGKLIGEKRASPATLAAYHGDISRFFLFLTDHLGGAPNLKALAGLEIRDFRAFLTLRRNEGLTSRSLARTLVVGLQQLRGPEVWQATRR